MRIFLINLDRSPGRLAAMIAQFDALGLQAERLPAVEGNSIDLSSDAFSGLRPGEIGCFLSHREAWRRLAESGEELALVLEDDVRLSQNLPVALQAAGKVDKGSRILKLDTSARSVALDVNMLAAGQRLSFARLCSEHTGTAGYIISAEAAGELLERSTSFSEPVDLFMFGTRAVALPTPRIFQAVPAVVAQEKRFGAVDGTELGSVIRQQKAGGASIPAKFLRELGRGVGKLIKFSRSLPSRVRGTRRYMRVPFA